MLNLQAATNYDDGESFANRLRNKRFSLFEKLVRQLPKPLSVIDIGGTEEFWQQRGWIGRDDIVITALNNQGLETINENFRAVRGDATNLAGFGDSEFDVAFSNSVIEHLFSFENQCKMAEEVRRVAKAYWIQTPNYWFPFEPHFHFVGWQWLPRSLRVSIIRRRRCGWRGPCGSVDEANAVVDEVQLMTRTDIKRAFPKAAIWNEPLFGMVKSLVAYDGFGKSIEDVEKSRLPGQ